MAEIVTKDGRRSTSGRKYQIKELRERHFEILRRALLGEKYTDIAAALNITPKNVQDVVNSDLGKEQLALMQSTRTAGATDIADDIAAVAPKSLRLLEATIDRTIRIVEQDPLYIPTGPVIKVAQDNLDRAGFGAVKKQEVRKTTLHFNAAELERAKQLNQQEADRALDAGRAAGIVVDSKSKEAQAAEDASYEDINEKEEEDARISVS